MVFIDLEKTYDKVPRNIMWWVLEKQKVPTKYITLIKDSYKNAMTFVRTCGGDITEFPINIGLHQGSALSPYLFKRDLKDWNISKEIALDRSALRLAINVPEP